MYFSFYGVFILFFFHRNIYINILFEIFFLRVFAFMIRVVDKPTQRVVIYNDGWKQLLLYLPFVDLHLNNYKDDGQLKRAYIYVKH